ncbi:MAG: restriction endonuclease subunit S [Candidatus Omnitrophota bacterium]|nr:restriction endonuclease subunit S [Candidatus Omnitrophota bacterium]
MSATWSKVRLGEVVTSVKRPVAPMSGTTYRQLGVKLWGEGAYERESMDGSATKYSTLSCVEADDIVVNKIWARNGSVAVVQPQLSGCFVSGEFPTFAANPERLLPRWMHWLTKTPGFWAQCDERSRGTSGKNRIKPEQFLNVEIPLPPLTEQRRIVARIEALAAKIAEARSLRHQAAEEAEMLMSRATAALLDETAWERKPLGEILAESPRNGLSPKSETESGGRPMLRINAVSSSPTKFVDLSAVKNVAVTDNDAAPFELQPNDVFIVRYNGDINRVAKPAIFKADRPSRAVFPDKLMRLRPILEKMTPDFLVFALNARSVREQVEELGKTTAGNIGVSGANAKSFVVSVPPLPEQRRIVAYLDGLQAQVDALKRLQAETAAELATLLPSVLAKAFRGELVPIESTTIHRESKSHAR